MFRLLFAGVLTLAALVVATPDARADFGVFSWSAGAKQWVMTQKYKDKINADSAAAICKSLGMQAFVAPVVAAPTFPATSLPVREAAPSPIQPSTPPMATPPLTGSRGATDRPTRTDGGVSIKIEIRGGQPSRP